MQFAVSRSSQVEVRRLGLVEYEVAVDLQKTLVEQRKRGEIADQLLLLEHPHVITLGVKTRNDLSHVLETPESLASRPAAAATSPTTAQDSSWAIQSSISSPIAATSTATCEISRKS
jgi:hypothetical protein